VIAIVDLRFLLNPDGRRRSYLFDGASDKAGNFFRRTRRDLLVGDFSAPPEYDDAVGDREDVGHAVADEHNDDALIAQ
jgi:hypothetical protein